jgi:hypothetical protein
MSATEPTPVPFQLPVLTASDEPPKKIKIQKRTPTERQMEALEKARLAKQKKGLIKEIQAQNSFLMPSPYLVGTILLGLGGLVAYSYLKPQMSYQTIQENSTENQTNQPPPQPIPSQTTPQLPPTIQLQTPQFPQPNQKTQEFFNGSMKI